MIIYFWRDWVRIIRAFFASIGPYDLAGGG